MIQDIADDGWMLKDDVQWGFEAVSRLGLTFDALGFPRHLANFHRIMTRHPEMRSVIDHCMKPQIHDPGQFDHWARGMTRLAEDTGAFVKFSALVTEASPDWGAKTCAPIGATSTGRSAHRGSCGGLTGRSCGSGATMTSGGRRRWN